MTFLRRIRQYRVYRRLVLSYLLLLVVSITLLSLILYYLFSAKAVQEIDRSNRQMLTQVSYTANVVYGQIQDVTGQLLSDHEIISFLYAKQDSKIVNYTVSLFLNRIQGVYPFIKNISVYNATTGAYIDSPGLASNPDMAASDQDSEIGFFPRKAQSVTGSTSYRLWTFKIVPERSFTEAPKSAIVVDLDETYIRNTMRNISASTEDSLTFVMDASGTILSHSTPEYFMEDFSGRDYVRTILADANAQGSFVHKIDHQKHLVTYVKSAKPDLYFVSVRPYAEMLSNIYELRDYTILVVVLLIVAGAAISLLLSGNIYNPIKVLLDKVNSAGSTGGMGQALLRYDEYELLTDAFTEKIETAKSLESAVQRSSNVLKDNYINHLLKGNANKIAVTAEMRREWESLFDGPCLTVILFKIDDYRAFRERFNFVDRGLVRFAVGNIAHELLGKFYRNDVANMEDDEIALIVQSEEPLSEDPPFLLLGEIQDAVRSYYRISLSVSIGDPCGSVSAIRDSYTSAQEYASSRLFLGYGCITTQAETSRRTPKGKPSYPVSIEKRLIEAVKLCHPIEIRSEIAEFRKCLSGCSYSAAMQYTQFLILGITKEFAYMTEWSEVDDEPFYRTPEQLREIETLDDIERKLEELCTRIVDILEQKKKNTSNVKNAKIVEEIRKFVGEQYAEHSLSLEMAAEHVGFSSGYIGKLFKSTTGITFNDYVTNVRMEKAKLRLAATNETVAQIGERVGVYNVPYFTTLFKKKFGITPSQYREEILRESQ